MPPPLPATTTRSSFALSPRSLRQKPAGKKTSLPWSSFGVSRRRQKLLRTTLTISTREKEDEIGKERQRYVCTRASSSEPEKDFGENGERRTTTTTTTTTQGGGGGRSRRRRRDVNVVVFATAGSSMMMMALGANFLGVTSLVLSKNFEGFARDARLDVVYAVNGYRREVNEEKGYEFLFPNEYLADQTVAERKARRRAKALDAPSLRRKKKSTTGEPESAFGPMGTNGEENMSVIVQPSIKGFDLSEFGNAEEQANWLLENVLARPGSGKEATLVSAGETVKNGITYFQFEYTIKTVNWHRRNVSVFAQNKKTGDVYTFVAQCPIERWDDMGEKFRTSANSFRIFPPKPPSF